MERDVEIHEKTVTKHLRTLILGALFFVFTFGVYHVWTEAYTPAIVEVFLFICLATAYVLLTKNLYVNYVMHGVMLAGLLGTLANMLTETTTAFWMPGLVVGAFALLGPKKGIYWVVIVNVSFLIFMLVDAASAAPLYPEKIAINLVISCFWISLVAFFAYRNTTQQHKWTLAEETERERKAMAQTLAGGMAHVMNNEMLVIVGRLECLQFRLNRKEDVQELGQVVDLAIKVSEHGNRLALYAQPDHEQKQAFHLYDTCVAVVKQHEKSLPREIQLNMKQPAFPIQCFGDEVQIAQALVQTVENAQDAIVERWKQRGRVSDGHIGISFDKENIVQHIDGLQPGEYVRITVADDGCGVSQDMRHQVFKPFVTTKLAGRGLGLAVAQSIIHRHGGKIHFESDVDKGSLFHIWLPISEDAKTNK